MRKADLREELLAAVAVGLLEGYGGFIAPDGSYHACTMEDGHTELAATLGASRTIGVYPPDQLIAQGWVYVSKGEDELLVRTLDNRTKDVIWDWARTQPPGKTVRILSGYDGIVYSYRDSTTATIAQIITSYDFGLAEAVATGLDFQRLHLGVNGPNQNDWKIKAYKAGVYVGYISFSTYPNEAGEDEIHIQVVEVAENYKRQGIATAMWAEMRDYMRSQYDRDLQIDPGMITPEGAVFYPTVQ